MAEFSYWRILTRRKTLTPDINHESKFSRVMNTFDLTTLGIGATLGVGVYVLAGHVARDQAGPSVVLSFAIAALTSLLAGICYAEFGARVPRAGSAYIYSYVCIGEFVAFVIGWNLILEYIIGSASVTKGISLYLDTLINDTLKNTFMEITPIHWGFLGLYFDLFAFVVALTFGICLAFGMQTSSIINNCLTILNLIIVAIVVVAGAFKSDIKNWQIDPTTVNATATENLGSGGFFPFGFEGTVKGAATCFFGFVGFDCIATTGEEVKDPERAIPKSILFTLLTIFLAYFSVATVLTLMWPYYLQDVNAPLPYVFQEIGWPALKWTVTIGGMIGLIASLFGAMFPLPRIIYAMSQDGLLFKSLGKISTKYKTPVFGTLCASLLTGLMGGLFELTQLVNMLSIGTLLAYTVVAISITILRFMDNTENSSNLNRSTDERTFLNGNQLKATLEVVLKQLINFKRLNVPNDLSTRIVGTILFFYCICSFAISFMIMYVPNEILSLQSWAIGILGTLSIILILLLLMISIQPREEVQSGFKVPFVPFIPGISIFVNIYLMLQLDIYTWIRFGIWMIIGIFMYVICSCLYAKNDTKNKYSKTIIPISNGKISFIGSPENYENDVKRNGALSHEFTTTVIIENAPSADNVRDNARDNDAFSASLTKLSLDDIIPESELSDNHREMKNPNGKSFFIESSFASEHEKHKDEEDEKSAIAILDDVLRTEESVLTIHEINDFNRKTSVDSAMIPSFIEASTIAMVHKSCESLKEEDDENMMDENLSPSKTFYSNQYVPNDFIIFNVKTEKYILSLNNAEKIQNDLTKISNNIILEETNFEYFDTDNNRNKKNEIKSKETEDKLENEPKLTSTEIISKIPSPPPMHKFIELLKSDLNVNETVSQTKALKQSNELLTSEKSPQDDDASRNKSLKSVPSSDIIEDAEIDPMHSQKFKNKLSQLISRPPLVISKSKKDIENESNHIKDENTEEKVSSHSVLKLSRSDSDIQNMILKEISSKSSDVVLNNSLNDKNSESLNDNSIPEAPKFDPVLYQTLGRRKHKKEISELETFEINSEANSLETTNPLILNGAIEVEEDPQEFSNSTSVPFKNKLEALLKRGPSYRVTKGRVSPSFPIVPTKIEKHSKNLNYKNLSPKNMNTDENQNITYQNNEHKGNFNVVLKSILQGKQPSTIANEKKRPSVTASRPTTIQEALKRLKPVA